MRECESKIAVVGEQEHAGRVVIESPDRNQARRADSAPLADKVVNRAPPLRIPHGRHDARRFVEHEYLALRHDDGPLVDGDSIAGFDLRSQLPDGVTVHADAAGDDQLLTSAARSDPRQREISLQPHGESATRPLNHALPRA